MTQQIIVVLLTLNFIVMLGCFWYMKQYLDDIHGHVFDGELDKEVSEGLFKSFVEGYYEEEMKKAKKKKDAK